MTGTVTSAVAGRVVVLADASSATGVAIRAQLLRAGAAIVALSHKVDGVVDAQQAADPYVVGQHVDLSDLDAAAQALNWALDRTAPPAAAVIVGDYDAQARVILATMAAHQLGFDHSFHPHLDPPKVIFFAPAEERPFENLAVPMRQTPMSRNVDVTVADWWPDTPRSAMAAVEQLLISPSAHAIGTPLPAPGRPPLPASPRIGSISRFSLLGETGSS